MKRTKRILAALLVAVMMFAAPLTNAGVAKAEVSTTDATSAVIQVLLTYTDQSGDVHTIKSGTAFLISDTYAITCYHVVNMTDAQKQTATEYYGVDFVNTTVSGLGIKIQYRGDSTIDATYVNGSETADFAILKLSSSLGTRTSLELGYSSEMDLSATVKALGFPAISDAFQDATTYSSDDVTVETGTITKFQTETQFTYIQHSAQLSDGSSGGPLLDSDNAVIGLNMNVIYSIDEDTGLQTTTYRSLAIDDIIPYLDDLNIEYTRKNSSEDTTTTTQAADENDATEEATDATEAQSTTEEVTTTEETTTTQAPTVEDEESGLPTAALIGIIAGVAVLIIVIIIIIVVVSGNNKKKKRAEQQAQAAKARQQAAAAQRPQPQRPQGGYGPTPQPQRQTYNQPNQGPTYGGPTASTEGAGETSVLNSGAGETTVLGGGPSATLRRVKTGENITVNKQIFTIGKERRKVDYCISDNTNISRAHAQIISKGDGFYIADQNSTNSTFVNGTRLNPRQEVKLNNGDRIKLADEEFEFRL